MLFLELWLSIPTPGNAAAAVTTATSVEPARRPVVVAPEPVTAPPTRLASRRTLPRGVRARPISQPLPEDPTTDELLRAALFPEGLIPVGNPPTPAHNRALAAALRDYLARAEADDVTALTRFVASATDSPWRVAVLVNLGLLHYRAGRFSRTFAAWEEAWRLGRDASDPRARGLADRAVGELAAMRARTGHLEALEALLTELEGRDVTGPATELLTQARVQARFIRLAPGETLRCGPMALDRIQAAGNPAHALSPAILASRATTNGFSLAALRDLSRQAGLNLRMARRTAGAPLRYPAVVHWKVGHYAALLGEADGRLRVEDAAFRSEFWIRPETLEAEASGYFLVPETEPLPAGWSAVEEAQGANVFGKGDSQGPPPGYPQGAVTDDPPPRCEGGGQPGGMPRASFEPSSASLVLSDIPVGYTPPRGPAVPFRVTYLHRESSQPASFTFSNLGPKWTFDWISFVDDNPSAPSAGVSLYLPGGGRDYFTGYNAATGAFATHLKKRTVLTRTSPTSYRLRFPDGREHWYEWAVGASPARRVFLTRILDPRGNGLDLLYDAGNRLVGLRDSLGQVTVIAHDLPGDAFKVTRVTDPFGRFARFEYNSSGRLTNIVDTLGLASGFAYGSGPGVGEVVTAMTTPYGTSRFAAGIDYGDYIPVAWLELTDPEGATERVEFRNRAPGIAFTDPAGVPQGMIVNNVYLSGRNTFHWDKKAFREAAGDFTKARVYHWLHDENANYIAAILESEKEPLENRVWYAYQGQTWAGGVNAAMIGRPAKIGRVLDDGTTQLEQYEYNDLGNVTRRVDPAGRTTTYVYAPNLIDVVQVRQTAGADDVLENRTYDGRHLPLTVDDGCGNTNRFAYNAHGQILALTNPLGETTAFQYDADGYLLAIDGPLPGAADVTAFTYDAFGRVRTRTDTEGHTLTVDYDALDRLVRTTYPDGTYEEETYHRLDRVAHRDRNGRITRYAYDPNRRLVSIEDPLHRVTRYDWCDCGEMAALTDAMGRTTTWHRDLQGRVTAKEYVDGSRIRYEYESATSRLERVIDEKGQIKLYEYWIDDRMRSVEYPNAENPTPKVTFTYDVAYDRLVRMDDGIGTTTYAYHPAGVQGGRLAAEDGPLAHDTITYEYDALGRLRTRAIDGVGQRWDYDALGRVAGVTNVLGAFAHTFVGASRRMARVDYPNGQWTEYDYFGVPGDHRLREIHHRLPGGETLARFAYTYDPAGQIQTWLQQQGAEVPEVWTMTYDAAQQLRGVVDTTNGVVKTTWAYAYDPAGNRLYEEVNGVRRSFAYNDLNQIVGADGAPGGDKSYSWDAAQRLVGIADGNRRHEIRYDGLGRYAAIRLWEGETLKDDRSYVWCDDDVCEARSAVGESAIRRYFEDGQRNGDAVLLFARDHLGSVRGVRVPGPDFTMRVGYEPFGTMTREGAALDADIAFTGHPRLPTGELLLTRYRQYDPGLARWLSRDPLEEAAGIGLYAYVENDPPNRVDPFGANTVLVGAVVVGGLFCLAAWQLRGIFDKKREEGKAKGNENDAMICYSNPDHTCPQPATTKSPSKK